MDEAVTQGAARPTVAGNVMLPVEYVTLGRLRTKDGEPVVVGCGPVSHLFLNSLLKGLPGSRPDAVNADALTQEDKEARAEAAMKLAPPILERGTFLLREDGTEVRPAFSWGPNPGESIPGHYVQDDDIIRMFYAILRVNGYVEGPATGGTFLDQRTGSNPSVGAIPPGQGDGEDAGGANARP